MGSAVGIDANPVSARDTRRVIANATALQIIDRANIVLRVLSCVKSCGVDTVAIFLVPDAFRTVNVSACRQYAARHGLMRVNQSANR